MVRLKLAIIGLISGALGLAGCSKATLLNLTIPDDGYSVKTDIIYGTLARQDLDIYLPNSATPNAPIVVFYYGGSWDSGDKEDYKFVGQAFAEQGFITVVPNYRVYPEVKYPTFLEDSAAALTWVQNNISDYGVSSENIFLAGHSAGAYNAMMVSVKPDLANTDSVKGMIGLAGAYDFLPLSSDKLKTIFGTVSLEETQPIKYARKTMPTLLLWSKDDETVWAHNGINMSTALTAKGTAVTQHAYDELSHVDMILALAKGFRDKADILPRITNFINKQKK